jgi:hypothetical protein
MRFLTPGVIAFFHVLHAPLGDLHRVLDVVCGVRVPTAAVRVAVACATVPLLGVVALLMWTLPASVDALIAGTTAIAWTRWLSRQEAQ